MSISYEAAGAVAQGTTTLSVALPSGGYSAGNIIIVKVATKHSAAGTVSDPTGWGGGFNRIGEMLGTFGTYGADTGPTRVVTFWKIATGTESGSLTFTITNGNSTVGRAYRFATSTGIASVVAFVGQDSSPGTGYSAACPAYAGAVVPGDMLTAFTAGPSDTVTWASQAFTATGLTIGSATEIGEEVTGNGNDIGGVSWYATVTSGTMSGTAVNATATLSSGTNAYGPAVVLRIRDSYPDPTSVPGLVSAPVGGTILSAGNLTVTPPAGAGTRIAFAFGDFANTLANAPTSYGWKLIGFLGTRAMYIATSGSPSDTWVCTGLTSLVVFGYDREVAVDQTLVADSLVSNTVVAPAFNAQQPALVTRIATGVTSGVPGTGYPSGHSTGQLTVAADLGGPYIFSATASKIATAGSIGSGTFSFGTTVMDAGSSVPDPMGMSVIAYTSRAPFVPVSPGSGIVWQDEFNTGSLDGSKWVPSYTPPGKFNGVEEQAYTPRTDNIELTGSELRIHLKRETYNADGISAAWTSGRITSLDMFRYGEYRARIWVPAGQGVWPAFWTLGNERVGGGGWPGIGEIDIMETQGPATTLYTALHGSDPSQPLPGEWIYSGNYSSVALSSGFWEFYVTWTPTGISWGAKPPGGSDTALGSKTKASLTGSQIWPFDNPQHLILNLATGGLGGGPTDGSTPNDNVMRVDWVRVSDAEVYPYSTSTDLAASGTVPVVTNLSGAVTANKSVAGTANVVTNVTGAVTANKTAAGTVDVVTNVTGSVTKQSAVSGTVTITTDVSGAVSATKAVSGTVSVTTDVSGDVTKQASLSGTVPVVTDVYGSMSAEDSLSGVVAVITSVSGAVTKQSAVSGTVVVETGVSGAVGVSHPVSGTVDIVTDVTGDLDAENSLSGTLSITTDVNGSVTKQSSVSATIDVVSNVTGNVSAHYFVSGTIDINTEVSGNVKLDGGDIQNAGNLTLVGAVFKVYTLTGTSDSMTLVAEAGSDLILDGEA